MKPKDIQKLQNKILKLLKKKGFSMQDSYFILKKMTDELWHKIAGYDKIPDLQQKKPAKKSLVKEIDADDEDYDDDDDQEEEDQDDDDDLDLDLIEDKPKKKKDKKKKKKPQVVEDDDDEEDDDDDDFDDF